jgi:hypothetical protein
MLGLGELARRSDAGRARIEQGHQALRLIRRCFGNAHAAKARHRKFERECPSQDRARREKGRAPAPLLQPRAEMTRSAQGQRDALLLLVL